MRQIFNFKLKTFIYKYDFISCFQTVCLVSGDTKMTPSPLTNNIGIERLVGFEKKIDETLIEAKMISF